MSATTAGPDVEQLRGQTLAEAPFPGGRGAAFRVWFAPDAHVGAWQHADAHRDVEICGVLVGTLAKDGDGPYVHVSAIIRGEAASNKSAEVTFTHETWARINQAMDREHANRAIVGWYHSHPSFGIFLSDRDRFIQEHFFSGPGQIAFVVDPVRRTEGVFVWKSGKPALAPHFWVGDHVQASTAAGEEPPPASAAATDGGATGEAAAAPSAAPAIPASWLSATLRFGQYALVFLLGFLLAGYLIRSLSELDRMRIAQAEMARALVYFQYRPGLGEELDQASDDMLKSVTTAKGLAQDHLKKLDDPAEAKQRWEEFLNNLQRAALRINRARLVYTPTPEETAKMLQMLGAAKLPAAGEKGKSAGGKAEPNEGKKDDPTKADPATPAKGK